MVVEKLLTNENLRIRFALDRLETVAELLLQGFDLTRDEIDLFCRTDPRVWFVGIVSAGPERHEHRRCVIA
jgi:Pyridine nucleotide-disulphide oxidoreductase